MIRWLAVLLTLFVSVNAFAASRTDGADRIIDATRFFEAQMETEDTAIPTSVLRDAKGILILRQYRAGFIFGGRIGRGIMMVKDQSSGEWSAPAFVKSGEGSFGLQIGGQSTDTIILIMNREGLDVLRESGFKIGVDASAAAGPYGRDVEAKIGPEVAMLAYSHSKGLYAGASIEGGLIHDDTDLNEQFYDKRPLDSTDIMFKREVPIPEEAKRLIKLIQDHSR